MATLTTPPKTSKTKPKIKKQPFYNVILHNDDDHSYQYVITMLIALFYKTDSQAAKCAEEVDKFGISIVDTTTLERAELKRDQIHAFGPDKFIPHCKGSMSATIEEA